MSQSITNISITDFSTIGAPASYTVYKIVLKSATKTWTVSRRYSEFETFHKQLKALGIASSAPFPSKKLSNNSKIVEERIKGLDFYVKDLLKIHANDSKFWTKSFVISFFEIDLPKLYQSSEQARIALLSNARKTEISNDSNQDNVNNQNIVMMKQDSALDQLSLVIQRQKQMGIAISEELDAQNKLLDKLSVDVDQSALKMKMTDKKLKKLF